MQQHVPTTAVSSATAVVSPYFIFSVLVHVIRCTRYVRIYLVFPAAVGTDSYDKIRRRAQYNVKLRLLCGFPRQCCSARPTAAVQRLCSWPSVLQRSAVYIQQQYVPSSHPNFSVRTRTIHAAAAGIRRRTLLLIIQRRAQHHVELCLLCGSPRQCYHSSYSRFYAVLSTVSVVYSYADSRDV